MSAYIVPVAFPDGMDVGGEAVGLPVAGEPVPVGGCGGWVGGDGVVVVWEGGGVGGCVGGAVEKNQLTKWYNFKALVYSFVY